MVKSKLLQSARGVTITIPPAALDELGVDRGSFVDVSVRNGSIHLRPRPVSRLTEIKKNGCTHAFECGGDELQEQVDPSPIV